ncbi:hypothetical protein PR048_027993 [Dryococelus australis]|uniref:Uncharacterized protein n=1 Tax=Dryococelus australis TaxID=614101 RepID=A0ABQ9GI24_9NEOP|nr:hypothetical protein PR048_027993 [Dryococelus australis]
MEARVLPGTEGKPPSSARLHPSINSVRARDGWSGWECKHRLPQGVLGVVDGGNVGENGKGQHRSSSLLLSNPPLRAIFPPLRVTHTQLHPFDRNRLRLVGKYKMTTMRQSWSSESMTRAIRAVENELR